MMELMNQLRDRIAELEDKRCNTACAKNCGSCPIRREIDDLKEMLKDLFWKYDEEE